MTPTIYGQTRYKDENGNFYWKFDKEVETNPVENTETTETVKEKPKKRR